MTVSVFFNIFIVVLVAGFAALAAKGSSTSLRDEKGPVKAYSFFWLFGAVLWVVVAARLFAAYQGYLSLDRTLFLVDQVFVALSLVAGAMYFSWRFFLKNSAAYVAALLYTVGGGAFLWLLYSHGITGPVINAWGTKYIPPSSASLVFSALLALMVLIALYDILASIIRKLLGYVVHMPAVLLSVSLVVYAMAAYFDEVAVDAGWQLMLVRSVYIVAIAIAYVGIVDFEKSKVHPILKVRD